MTEFEKFFAGEFQRRIAETTVPGMADASWDRKAAWLLWETELRSIPSHARASLRSPEPAPAPALTGGLFD